MTSGERGVAAPARQEVPRHQDDLTTSGILRMLGSGATGAILMALGDGPLRTKELTERVPGYAARTIYRYAGKLSAVGVIEREEEPGVPSKVVHRLSDPCGRELFELVDAYADASLSRLPNVGIGAHAWGSLALLADLWESGMVGELDLGPRTATELARMRHGLSYHQVSRRASMFAIGGLIRELPPEGRQRRYELTTKARRGMALIAAVGRWRRRHVVPGGMAGLSAREAATVLRAALPLARVPIKARNCFEFAVAENGGGRDAEPVRVWGEATEDGALRSLPSAPASLAGRGHGRVEDWVDCLLDGPGDGRLALQGDGSLVLRCLGGLHGALWTPSS